MAIRSFLISAFATLALVSLPTLAFADQPGGEPSSSTDPEQREAALLILDSESTQGDSIAVDQAISFNDGESSSTPIDTTNQLQGDESSASLQDPANEEKQDAFDQVPSESADLPASDINAADPEIDEATGDERAQSPDDTDAGDPESGEGNSSVLSDSSSDVNSQNESEEGNEESGNAVTEVANTLIAEVADPASSEPPLEEGTYGILNGAGDKYAVDVSNSSLDDGTPVALFENNFNPWQQYSFQYVGDGQYVIVATHSGKALTASSDSDTISQQTLNYNDAQLWTLKQDGGKWRIYSVARDLYMDVEGGNAGNFVRVRLWQYTATSGQLFVLKYGVTEGVYAIEIRDNSNQVLDVVASSQADGANVTSYNNDNDANQQFIVRMRSDGYYEIIASHSGKALDVVNSEKTAGTNVTQWSYHGGLNQQ